MELNINEYVEFVLTASGAEQLNNSIYTRNEFLWKRTGKQEYLDKLKNHEGLYKEGDTYREQFWAVMKIFGGSNIELGYEAFCKSGTITFNAKEKTNDGI